MIPKTTSSQPLALKRGSLIAPPSLNPMWEVAARRGLGSDQRRASSASRRAIAPPAYHSPASRCRQQYVLLSRFGHQAERVNSERTWTPLFGVQRGDTMANKDIAAGKVKQVE